MAELPLIKQYWFNIKYGTRPYYHMERYGTIHEVREMLGRRFRCDAELEPGLSEDEQFIFFVRGLDLLGRARDLSWEASDADVAAALEHFITILERRKA